MGRAEDLFKRIEDSGISAIEDLIVTRQSEELFLDFKRSGDDGGGKRLHDSDRENLAKAISGFGNSEGGIVIWGIDCSRDDSGADVAKGAKPLVDASRFRSLIEQVISGSTLPAHQGVRNFVVQSPGSREGYVVTLIPQSGAAPHRALQGKEYYYVRVGSNFLPAPHGVLAGMFGRRPQPHVTWMFSSKPPRSTKDKGILVGLFAEFEILLRNRGPGIAKDLYVVVTALSSPKGLSFTPNPLYKWDGTKELGVRMSLISPPDFRMAPQATIMAVTLEFQLRPPFNKEMNVEGFVGAGSSPPEWFRLQASPTEMEEAYEEYVNGSNPDLERFHKKMFGIEKNKRSHDV